MAKSSLISDLLKSPSQIRAEEQEALRQKGLQRAALVRGSGGAGQSLFGGMFRDFAAQQAADVDLRTDQLKRSLGQVAGVDMRSGAEQQAARQQEVLRQEMPTDLTGLEERRKKLAAANVPPQILERLDLAIEAKRKEIEEDGKNTRRAMTVATYIESKYPNQKDLAVLVRDGGIPPAKALEIASKEIETKVVGEGDTLVDNQGNPLFTAPEAAGDTFSVLSGDEVRRIPELDPSLTYQRNNKTGKLSVIGGDEIVPNAGQGWQTTRVRNSDGTVTYIQTPVPGGEVDRAIQEAREKQARGERAQFAKVSRIRGQVDRARGLIADESNWAVGKAGRAIDIAGSLTGGFAVAETSRLELSETLGTLKANLGIDKLQEMRDNSPTGGALGNVSNFELQQLERAVDSLNPDLGREALGRNLDTVEKQYEIVLTEFANAYSDQELIENGLADVIPYRTITLDENGNKVILADEVPEDKVDKAMSGVSSGTISQIRSLANDPEANLSGIATSLGISSAELKEWLKANE